MVFSSIEFLWFFMPVVLGLYFVVPPRGRNVLLALVSLVFYAWGAHAIVLVFLGSIAINYTAGRLIGHYKRWAREQAVRRVVFAAVVIDLGILFVWKYTVFAADQALALLGFVGDHHAFGRPSIALPIGISFFTFHAISYVVDCARETAPPMRNVANFTQYMAFFPQLIAGPIVRYHQIDDQIRQPPPRSQRLQDLADGFPRFALGLCKKVLIADQVSQIANAAFANTHGLTTPAAWLGALAFTVQIYFDFSGYSDMAIGLARMFGFRFPENFNRPYSAVSMTDFWRRWHMTLSGWFRDYVYIPIGGNRGTRWRTSFNLLFVFLLTGFWHGAAWTFFLWGLYNGVILVVERLTGVARLPDARLAVGRRAGTFALVVLGWVLFRAVNLHDAIRVYHDMIAFNFGPLPATMSQALGREQVLALIIGLATVFFPRDLVLGQITMDGRWSGAPLYTRFATMAVLPFAAIAVAAGSFSPFLYFRF